MNKTVEDYVHTQLSSAGFVLLEAAIAYQLRPDLWPNLMQCRHHFAAVRPKLIQSLTAAGVQFFKAWIGEAKDPVLGACRSRRDLPRRIEYVLGAPVKVDLVDAAEKRICGAIAKRTGKPCRCKLLYPNGHCRYHGGLSTGPRTAEGKRRALANLKQYRTQEVTVDSPAPRHSGQAYGFPRSVIARRSCSPGRLGGSG